LLLSACLNTSTAIASTASAARTAASLTLNRQVTRNQAWRDESNRRLRASLLDVAHAALIAVYVLSAVLEIVGIVATVEVLVRDNRDGTLTIDAPEGWRRWRGPAVIGSGSSSVSAATSPLCSSTELCHVLHVVHLSWFSLGDLCSSSKCALNCGNAGARYWD
jgi:hypothetical protein